MEIGRRPPLRGDGLPYLGEGARRRGIAQRVVDGTGSTGPGGVSTRVRVSAMIT